MKATNGTTSSVTLLQMPLSEQGGERHSKVHEALRRAGADIKTLAGLLDWSPVGRAPIPQRGYGRPSSRPAKS